MDDGFVELNADQRKETVNARQRFAAVLEAETGFRHDRGSVVWTVSRGHQYLVRAAYDRQGRRRQSSLGRRSPETEQLKATLEERRGAAEERLAAAKAALARQAAVNRALDLGRVPLAAARVLRALDGAGLLGGGLRVLGTNALYAYEAAAGVHIAGGLTATDDIDLLVDSRHRLSFVLDDDLEPASLLHVLRRADRTFHRTRQTFRAANDAGFLVDLIRPMRNPPWGDTSFAEEGSDDLSAVEIAGLVWHENAPAFTATAIDERGAPLRIVTTDPRVFAIHKHWLSRRDDREPIARRRDAEQAAFVARLVTTHLLHLPFEPNDLRMMPKAVVADAQALFAARR